MSESDLVLAITAALISYFGDNPASWFLTLTNTIAMISGYAAAFITIGNKVASLTPTEKDDGLMAKLTVYFTKVRDLLDKITIYPK